MKRHNGINLGVFALICTLAACSRDVDDTQFSREAIGREVVSPYSVEGRGAALPEEFRAEADEIMSAIKQACSEAVQKLKTELGGCPAPVSRQAQTTQSKPGPVICLAMAFKQQILTGHEECRSAVKQAIQFRKKIQQEFQTRR